MNLIDNPLMQDEMHPKKLEKYSFGVSLASIGVKLSNHIANHSIHVTQEEKDKWNSKEDFTQVLEQLYDKANVSDIPTKLSQLENDIHIVSENDVYSKSIIDQKLLNVNDSINTLSDRIDNVISDIDLSDYYNKSEIDDIISNLEVSGIAMAEANTTTLLPGAPATVAVTLVNNTLAFTFGIPQGEKGEQGERGLQGPKGDKGDKGDPGAPGQSGSISDSDWQEINDEIANKVQQISGDQYNELRSQLDNATQTIGAVNSTINEMQGQMNQFATYTDVDNKVAHQIYEKFDASTPSYSTLVSSLTDNGTRDVLSWSQIEQTTDRIDLIVSGTGSDYSNIYTAISAGLKEDTSFVNIIANQVNVSGDLQAKSLKAGTGPSIYIGNDSSNKPTIVFSDKADYTDSTAKNSIVIGNDAAKTNDTSVLIKSDGSGYLAKNNLQWDSNGNITITGKIHSSSFYSKSKRIIGTTTDEIVEINPVEDGANMYIVNTQSLYNSLTVKLPDSSINQGLEIYIIAPRITRDNGIIILNAGVMGESIQQHIYFPSSSSTEMSKSNNVEMPLNRTIHLKATNLSGIQPMWLILNDTEDLVTPYIRS